MKEALDKGAELFNWDERKARSGQAQRLEGARRRRGGEHVLGRLDRLRRAARHQAGRPAVRSSRASATSAPSRCSTCHRVAAEMLGVPWEKVDVTWGNTSKNLPWTCGQGGSQTTHAMTRAAHAAGIGRDARSCRRSPRRRSAAARSRIRWPNERVSGGGRSMTLAQAAQKAIELGGKYDGHELPDDINAFTRRRRPRWPARG